MIVGRTAIASGRSKASTTPQMRASKIATKTMPIIPEPSPRLPGRDHFGQA